MYKQERDLTRTNFISVFKITVRLWTVQYVNGTCAHLWETAEVNFHTGDFNPF